MLVEARGSEGHGVVWGAVTLALASAVAAGWSTALMHHGASGARRGAGAVELARHVVSQWRWLLGVVASLAGLGLHAAALHAGTLTLVQPLAVTALLFALVFRDLLDRRLPSRTTVLWGAVTAGGLGLFLGAAEVGGGADQPDPQAAAVLVVLGAAGAALALRASGQHPAYAGLWLGTAGGIVFGLMAGAIKSATSVASLGELVTTWPLYLMVTVGLTGFVLNQHVYHRTRLAESLPMLNLVNPLVALTFGAVVFAERPTGSLLATGVQALGLGAVLAGIFVLGRTTAPELERPAAPQASTSS